jgi:hypothetical protein
MGTHSFIYHLDKISKKQKEKMVLCKINIDHDKILSIFINYNMEN